MIEEKINYPKVKEEKNIKSKIKKIKKEVN
jgi:hypothetical protein